MGYRIINGVQYPTLSLPIDNDKTRKTPIITNSTKALDFNSILQEKLTKKEGFTISNHAAERMQNINFNPSDMNKINEAINRATEKGVKNCLIVYRDIAMITSVENRTVITAVDKSRAKDNVFTNIDSVILL